MQIQFTSVRVMELLSDYYPPGCDFVLEVYWIICTAIDAY